MLSEISQAQEDILSVVYPVWDLEEEMGMEVRGRVHLETWKEKEGRGRKGITGRYSPKALFEVLYMHRWQCHNEIHYLV